MRDPSGRFRGLPVSGRPLIVANPAAGGGRGRDRWRAAAGLLADRLGAFEVVWTEAPGDAEAIARREGDSRSLLVAFGGDGTASEIARGLALSGGAAELGLLPCGTGNDFARDVGIPARLPDAVRLLARERGRPTDLGRLESQDEAGEAFSRAFLNSCSLGLAASVVQRIAGSPNRLGPARYAAAAVREIARFTPKQAGVRLDDEPERPRILLNFTALNSRRFGGGIRLAPPADPGDGLLDAVLVGPLGPLALADAVARLLRGAHFGRPEIEHRPIRQASVRPIASEAGADQPFAVELDGETVSCRGAVTVSVLPGAVTVRRGPGP